MDEGLSGHSGIQKMGDWGGVVNYGPGDNGMVVMFFMKAVVNPARSQAEGSPQYDDQVFVRIHPPGERLNIIERIANDGDKRRFPQQWHLFQQNKPQTNNGIPIDLLFPAHPSISAALKASGVHTVEQCAELSAHAIENIGMGCQQWVNDAARYLEVANKGVKASQLKAMSEEKDREINGLKHKINLLETELAHLREVTTNAVTMKDVQQMMANAGGNQGQRPRFVPGKDQPFDAQTAQINGTHATRDLAKAKAKKPEPPARKRARVV
jgi:hypothetical protein